MLQFPYGVYPDNQAIDGELENTFFCVISGTVCTAYQINIYENSTNKLLYTGEKTEVSKYNQETLNMNVPANSFINGVDLIWNMKLWTNVADMFIVSGKVVSLKKDTSGNVIGIIPSTDYSKLRVKAGQKIQINGLTYTIKSYYESTDPRS